MTCEGCSREFKAKGVGIAEGLKCPHCGYDHGMLRQVSEDHEKPPVRRGSGDLKDEANPPLNQGTLRQRFDKPEDRKGAF